jgi:pimeloyl-ACP methyl ester carboxylesterase
MTHIVFFLRLFAAATLAAVMAGCASLSGSRTLTFTESDVARLIERNAPLDRRLLEVIDVHVSTPRVKMLPDVRRLFTEMDVKTTERVSGKSYGGRIALDYALRYDEAAQAIRLTQVRVSKFELDGVPSPTQRGLGRLGALIAETMLDDLALYRFKPEDLRNAEGRGLKPGAVTVTSRGVEVTLAPLR